MYSPYIFSVAVLFLSRSAFVALVAICLLAGIGGGLVRAGVGLPGGVMGGLSADWMGAAMLSHAFLMICGFLGTVIGIERAVAVKARLAFVAPAASGLAGLLALAGAPAAGAWLAVGAAAAFTGVNLLVVARQRAAHTIVLLAGAMAWLVGTLLHAFGTLSSGVIPWWFSFLILTIAAERLEMTRLMRRSAGAAPALYAALGLLLVGAGWSARDAAAGGVLFGVSLLCLALWLGRFDIARRTVKARGLSRYMAVCLLLGYFWLALAGIAWAAASLGYPARDAALHGLAIGFVFSMILGHAPVILPAVLRIKLLFGAAFYLPLALLHASLALRIFGAPMAPELLPLAAAGNAMAIAAFALTMAAAAAAWHLKYSSNPPHTGHDHAVEN